MSRLSVCDGHVDCSDGSDERNCVYIRKQARPEPRGGRKKYVSVQGQAGNKTQIRSPVSWKIKDQGSNKDFDAKLEQEIIEKTDDKDLLFKTDQDKETTIKYVDFQPPPLFSENLIQSPRLDVKVYPPKQMIYKNSDVTIQCRDEGMKCDYILMYSNV